MLRSRRRLADRWPTSIDDVQLLLATMQIPDFTLHDVLETGFVTIEAESVPQGLLGLRHRRALGLVDALNRDGAQVASPKQHPRQVAAVTVHDVVVDGVPAVRRSA